METLWKVLLTIVGIAAMFLLLSLTFRFFEFRLLPEKASLEGDKSYVVDMLLRYLYKCWERYKGKAESIICSYLNIKSADAISSADVVSRVDATKIDPAKVKASEIGSVAEVIIRYENDYIYIEKVEHERIST